MPDPVYSDHAKFEIAESYKPIYSGQNIVAEMKENDNEETDDKKRFSFTINTRHRPFESSSGKPAGVIGLQNLGNTCFMNSTLQCLFNTQFLVKYFLESPIISNVIPPSQALAYQFQKLIKEVWWGKSPTALYINEFRNVLGNICPQFKDGRQHDCQEFLAITLDTLHEQLKKCNKLNERAESMKKGIIDAKKDETVENQGVDNKQDNDVDMTALTVSPPNKRRKEDDNIKIREKGLEFWDNHVANNNTVITKNFQGLYKSTVICSACSFVSVTYEPFTYLSLPLVANRNYHITFVSLKSKLCVKKIEVKVHLMESISKFKSLVAKQIYPDENDQGKVGDLIVAEVGSNRIFRILDGGLMVKNMNYSQRNIYVYELNTNFDELYPPTTTSAVNGFITGSFTAVVSSSTQMAATTYLAEDWETDDAIPPVGSGEALGVSYDTADVGIGSPQVTSSTESGIGSSDEKDMADPEPSSWIQCNICLDEFPEKLIKQHRNCTCILCDNCIKSSVDHFIKSEEALAKYSGNNNLLKCAMCMIVDDYRTFVSYGTDHRKSSINLQLVNVYIRNDPNPDNNNNSTFVSRCLGTPLIVRLPSIISAHELNTFLKQYNPFPNRDCKILSVSQDGKACNYCMFNDKCQGCEIKKEGDIPLKPNTCFAISLIDLSKEEMSGVEPDDMLQINSNYWRQDDPVIDIHDCVKAFLEIEKLDEQNPWFCPDCKKNQCATKAISICKFPDYLIVYLKRFIFIDHSSNKLNNRLKFPVTDFNLSSYVSREFAGNELSFDLYSCVCHFGSSHSGHYTAYGKSPLTDSWHYFNDSIVNSSTPSEKEYATAYVLFYQKKGIKIDIPMENAASYDSSSFSPSKPIAVVTPTLIPTVATPMLAIGMKGQAESSWTADSTVTSTVEPDSSGLLEAISNISYMPQNPGAISLNEMTELSISSSPNIKSYTRAPIVQLNEDEVDEGLGGEIADEIDEDP